MLLRTKLLTLACLVASLALMAFAAPRPKAARSPRVTALPCVAGQECKLVLSWTRPVNFAAATDTARVDWDQALPTVFNDIGGPRSPLGTTDTLAIMSRPDGAPKSGTVNLCHTRAGWTGRACNTPLAWVVKGEVPVVPPDTATGLILTPVAFTVAPGQSQIITATAVSN
jgi:hypothetical protein